MQEYQIRAQTNIYKKTNKHCDIDTAVVAFTRAYITETFAYIIEDLLAMAARHS